ncbi:SAF domain-containing protein [Brachybacterium sp. p3-SID1565]|uniref:Flagellar biosynthesis protein FlgA n=1 Tax=Brachybacterium epidermidis TaxID=2781983 RepID=A0ABR9VXR8_9MICO|nr:MULTISPECIES: SAF domain-containing protein [Brachybacterium]MBE9402971.1 flagellar biosynthesis protein FlgA [Brachybacterium epidermidis]MCT1386505.1 SAF domain-containing protein [Brachybacterium sp. p3-SID1565]MCT1776865.1 SAF domain-containing protein [Brachybacterium sp. p3-SID957]
MGVTAPVMRLRRPRWKDPRLIIGIVLVVASVLMGALLVSRLSATTPVLVARGTIVPGEEIDPDQLTTVELRLGEQEAMYVGSVDAVPEGAVATRTIQAGELLPVSALGQGADVPLRPVVIPVDATVAESVVPGAEVELWHTRPSDVQDASGQGAELLVSDAVVRRVDEGSSLGMRSMAVEVLVPKDQVGPLLEVLARGERLDVIGVPGTHGIAP